MVVILGAILHPELQDPEPGVGLEGARGSVLVEHLDKCAPGQVNEKQKKKTKQFTQRSRFLSNSRIPPQSIPRFFRRQDWARTWAHRVKLRDKEGPWKRETVSH